MTATKFQTLPKVGDNLNGWVVGRIWEHDKHFDLAMYKEGEPVGSFRIMKKNIADQARRKEQ